MSSEAICHNCGSSEIERDQGRGDDVCTNCGCVLQENIAVGEVEFEDNGRGGSSMVSNFVAHDGQVRSSFSKSALGIGRNSKQITLHNGHRKINQVAQQIQLSKTCIDLAFNYYKIFVQKHFTRGRKMSHVIAACIYLACRDKATPHMLLDISDVVQVNVYELGKTYLRFLNALNIKLPAMDPNIYIIRFAHKLNFGDKTPVVINTAMRLVTRMKKDLISDGRRPSGLCGAALLVAARLHEISITVEDVIKVVKVGQSTLRSRLTEFGETPSGQLTLDEFMNIDLEEEQDPPCVKAAKRNKKIKILEEQNKLDLVTKQVGKVHRMIEKALNKQRKKFRGPFARFATTLVQSDDDEVVKETEENENIDEIIMQDTLSTIQSVVEVGNEETVEETATHTSIDPSSPEKESPNKFTGVNGPGPTASSLGIKGSIEDFTPAKECESMENEADDSEFADLDDEELDAYIMNEEEVLKKTELWMKINADYLEKQKVKEEEALAREKEDGSKQDVKKRRKYKKKHAIQASTAGEAIEKMLLKRKISNKINYDVLKNLNNEIPESNKKETVVEPMHENVPDISAPQSNNRMKRKVTFDSPTVEVQNKISRTGDVTVDKDFSKTANETADSDDDDDKDESATVSKIVDDLEEELEDDEEDEQDEELKPFTNANEDEYEFYGYEGEEDEEYFD